MRGRRVANQRGSFVVEVVIMAPVMMLGTLLVVHHGRVAGLDSKVAHAADSAARAASLVDEPRQPEAARRIARSDLAGSGAECLSQEVGLRRHRVGEARFVTVRVSCTSSIEGLGLIGARAITVTHESTEQIDVYTSRG